MFLCVSLLRDVFFFFFFTTAFTHTVQSNISLGVDLTEKHKEITYRKEILKQFTVSFLPTKQIKNNAKNVVNIAQTKPLVRKKKSLVRKKMLPAQGQVPVKPVIRHVVIPPRKPHARDVVFDGWPVINSEELIELMDYPADGYIGMTAYGSLFFLPTLKDEYIDYVLRFYQAMNAMMRDHILPIKSFWPEVLHKDLLLPDNIEEANIKAVKDIIRVVESNEVSNKVYRRLHPQNTNCKKRFEELEDKVMVIGCGANHDKHKNVHPAKHTFTIDPTEDMGPDFVIDAEIGVHLLPNKEYFSVIFFESVPDYVFEYDAFTIAMLNRVYRLLKPGGILLIKTGCITICDLDRYNIPEIMRVLLTDSDIIEHKFIGKDVRTMFTELYRGEGDFFQKADDLWSRTLRFEFKPKSRQEASEHGVRIIAIKR